MIDVVQDFFKDGFHFKGRTSRSTFWVTILWLFLLGLLIEIGTGAIDTYMNNKAPIVTYVVFIILSIICLIPSFALQVRRLHDINKSGLWILLLLVPYIGEIVLFIFYCLPSNNRGNKY